MSQGKTVHSCSRSSINTEEMRSFQTDNFISVIAVLVFFAFISLTTPAPNAYKGFLNTKCHGYRSIYKLISNFSNFHKDRKFDIRCRTTPGAGTSYTCKSWSFPPTTLEDPIRHECPENYYLNGIRSFFSNNKKDRRWQFRCCKRKDTLFVKYVMTSDCRSSILNSHKKYFNYKVPPGYHTHTIGAFRIHPTKKDRRWYFTYCKIKIEIGGLKRKSK